MSAESELHKRVDSTLRASEAAKPAAPPLAYGSDPKWQCLGCAGWPLGGYYDLPAVDVRRLAEQRNAAVFVEDAGELRVCCGRDCLRRVQVDVAHGNRPAVTVLDPLPRVAVESPKTYPVGPHGAYRTREERVARAVCAANCGASARLDQCRIAEGDWTPDFDGFLRISGWTVTPAGKFCSRVCLERAKRPAPPPVVPVLSTHVARAVPVPPSPVLGCDPLTAPKAKAKR